MLEKSVRSLGMHVERKEKEAAQQLVRRFNRLVQSADLIREVREGRYFARPVTRFMRKEAAKYREKVRRERSYY